MTQVTIYLEEEALGAAKEAAAKVKMSVSSISIFESQFGLAKSNNPGHSREFLQKLHQRSQLLPLDKPSAAHAGRLRACVAALAQPIGPYDLLIAGTVLAHNLTLVTRNTRKFERVPGLKIENWHD